MKSWCVRTIVFIACFFIGWTISFVYYSPLNPNDFDLSVKNLATNQLYGCWLGKEGGFLRFDQDRVYFGSRGYSLSPVHFEKDLIRSDYLFDTGQGGMREAGTLDRIVSVKFTSDKTIKVFTYESEDDYFRVNNIGDELNLERVSCDYVIFLTPKHNNVKRPYQGQWLGLQGSQIFIGNEKYKFRNNELTYNEVEHKVDSWGEKYVLKVTGKIWGYDSEERFFVIRFRPDDEMYWIRFESQEDYLRNRYTGIGRFWRPVEPVNKQTQR